MEQCQKKLDMRFQSDYIKFFEGRKGNEDLENHRRLSASLFRSFFIRWTYG